MSETKYEVYNVLDNPPKHGEVVQTAIGIRAFNNVSAGWDNIWEDDTGYFCTKDRICDSYYYSYDTRAQDECRKSHNNLINEHPNLKDKNDWGYYDFVKEPHNHKDEEEVKNSDV